jgi:hypothetical protein
MMEPQLFERRALCQHCNCHEDVAVGNVTYVVTGWPTAYSTGGYSHYVAGCIARYKGGGGGTPCRLMGDPNCFYFAPHPTV